MREDDDLARLPAADQAAGGPTAGPLWFWNAVWAFLVSAVVGALLVLLFFLVSTERQLVRTVEALTVQMATPSH